MLLLHPVLTSADAGPDLCTLRLWCFPSFNWCNHGGGRRILVCGGGGCCYGVLVLGKCAGVSQRKY